MTQRHAPLGAWLARADDRFAESTRGASPQSRSSESGVAVAGPAPAVRSRRHDEGPGIEGPWGLKGAGVPTARRPALEPLDARAAAPGRRARSVTNTPGSVTNTPIFRRGGSESDEQIRADSGSLAASSHPASTRAGTRADSE